MRPRVWEAAALGCENRGGCAARGVPARRRGGRRGSVPGGAGSALLSRTDYFVGHVAGVLTAFTVSALFVCPTFCLRFFPFTLIFFPFGI